MVENEGKDPIAARAPPVALEQVEVAQQLVLAAEGRLARARPLLAPAVLLVRLQVRHHRELLGAALAANATDPHNG